MLDYIFQYEFLQNAFLSGLLISIIAPIIGIFIVVRRMSFISDTLAHVTLAGTTIGVFLNSILVISLAPSIWGLIFAIVGAFVIEFIRSKYSEFKEVSLVIVMSISIAFAIVFSSLTTNGNSITSYLFGSINTVSHTDLIILAIAVVATFVFVLKNYYLILSLSFDETYANATNRKVVYVKYLFILFSAIIIALMINLVGALLVGALLILPVLSAMKIANSFKSTLIISIIISILSMISGLILAVFMPIPPGSLIVLINFLCMLISLIYRRLK